MSLFSVLSRVGLGAGAVLLCATLVAAEEHPAEFPISEKQMRALGIELTELRPRGANGGASLPAQVVVPPRRQHSLNAPVAAQVTEVLVEDNQVVAAGAPLLVLSGPELGTLRLSLAQAASRARLAEQTLARDKALFEEGIIPQRRVQEAESAALDSRAALAQAEAALSTAGMSRAQIQQSLAGGDVGGRLTITAPAAGTVVRLAVKPGQRVAGAEPLLDIVQLDRLWLEIRVPAGQAGQWPVGSRVRADGGIEAKVVSVGAVTGEAQTVVLRAVIEGGAGHLRPGTWVRAELPLPAGDGWEIPLAALVREGDQAYVFVRHGEVFVTTPVQVLANSGQLAVVEGSLKKGASVAVSGTIALKAAWMGIGGLGEE